MTTWKEAYEQYKHEKHEAEEKANKIRACEFEFHKLYIDCKAETIENAFDCGVVAGIAYMLKKNEPQQVKEQET